MFYELEGLTVKEKEYQYQAHQAIQDVFTHSSMFVMVDQTRNRLPDTHVMGRKMTKTSSSTE